MEYVFFAIGVFGLSFTASVVWHLLTDEDCNHTDVGQSGECQRCGANIEIGGSE